MHQHHQHHHHGEIHNGKPASSISWCKRRMLYQTRGPCSNVASSSSSSSSPSSSSTDLTHHSAPMGGLPSFSGFRECRGGMDKTEYGLSTYYHPGYYNSNNNNNNNNNKTDIEMMQQSYVHDDYGGGYAANNGSNNDIMMQHSPSQRSTDSGFAGDGYCTPVSHMSPYVPSQSEFLSPSMPPASSSSSSYCPPADCYYSDSSTFPYDNHNDAYAYSSTFEETSTTTAFDSHNEEDLSRIVDQVLNSIDSQYNYDDPTAISAVESASIAVEDTNLCDNCGGLSEGKQCRFCGNVVLSDYSVINNEDCSSNNIIVEETNRLESTRENKLTFPKKLQSSTPAQITAVSTSMTQSLPQKPKKKNVAAVQPMQRSVGVVEPRVVVKIPKAKLKSEDTNEENLTSVVASNNEENEKAMYSENSANKKRKKKHHGHSKKKKRNCRCCNSNISKRRKRIHECSVTTTLPRHFIKALEEVSSKKSNNQNDEEEYEDDEDDKKRINPLKLIRTVVPTEYRIKDSADNDENILLEREEEDELMSVNRLKSCQVVLRKLEPNLIEDHLSRRDCLKTPEKEKSQERVGDGLAFLNKHESMPSFRDLALKAAEAEGRQRQQQMGEESKNDDDLLALSMPNIFDDSDLLTLQNIEDLHSDLLLQEEQTNLENLRQQQEQQQQKLRQEQEQEQKLRQQQEQQQQKLRQQQKWRQEQEQQQKLRQQQQQKLRKQQEQQQKLRQQQEQQEKLRQEQEQQQQKLRQQQLEQQRKLRHQQEQQKLRQQQEEQQKRQQEEQQKLRQQQIQLQKKRQEYQERAQPVIKAEQELLLQQQQQQQQHPFIKKEQVKEEVKVEEEEEQEEEEEEEEEDDVDYDEDGQKSKTQISLEKDPDDEWLYCQVKNCHFWTRKPTRMARHQKCHGGTDDDKYYVCPDCSAKFYSLAKMLKHDRKFHTGEKDYECKICEAEVTDIHVHMRVHRADKEFKCTTCSVTFRHKNSLVRHVFQHTGERPYRCQSCECAFVSITKLKEHIRRRHPNTPAAMSIVEHPQQQQQQPIQPKPVMMDFQKQQQPIRQYPRLAPRLPDDEVVILGVKPGTTAAINNNFPTAAQATTTTTFIAPSFPSSYLASGPNGSMYLVTPANPSPSTTNIIGGMLTTPSAPTATATTTSYLLSANNFINGQFILPAQTMIPQNAGSLIVMPPPPQPPPPPPQPQPSLIVQETVEVAEKKLDILQQAILEIPDNFQSFEEE